MRQRIERIGRTFVEGYHAALQDDSVKELVPKLEQIEPDFRGFAYEGAAMGLVFVPLTTITNGPIPKEQMGNATSIFNLMRNIGASIGIASVTTTLARHQQVHTNNLGQFITPFNQQVQNMIQGMKNAMIARGSDPVIATKQAYAQLYGMVQQQAAMMSYNDTFIMMAWIAAAMLPLIFLMQKPKKTDGPVMAH